MRGLMLHAGVAALVLVALAGCSSPGLGGTSSFEAPALPADFVAEYAGSQGQSLTLTGKTKPSLDRFGQPAQVLLVGTDGGGVTFAVDACGGPGWQAAVTGDASDRRLQIDEFVGPPLPLLLQGRTWRAGDLVLDMGAPMMVDALRSDGLVVTFGTLRFHATYGDGAPVPITWSGPGEDWTLARYEGVPAGACADPGHPALAPWTSSVLPDVPATAWPLQEVMDYLEGPFAPAAYRTWADAHADAWLSWGQHSPYALTPKPGALEPRAWMLAFASADGTGMLVLCDSDLADRLAAGVRPLQCSTAEHDPDARMPPAATLPAAATVARGMSSVGLSVDQFAFEADGTNATFSAVAWRPIDDGFGFHFFHLRWRSDGTLAWASLPADTPIV